MPTLQDAIDDFYEIAVRQAMRTSTKRLSLLAEYCIAEFDRRGLHGAEAEATIEGGGRPKSWDVAWQWMRKYRCTISLKSILRNLAGTVPNRIDDLMGETANIQLYSPEVVTGYVMVFDVSRDAVGKSGKTWHETLVERLDRLAVRRAPYWTPSTFEACAIVRVDFSQSPRIIDGEQALSAMFDRLADETMLRNPGIREDGIA